MGHWGMGHTYVHAMADERLNLRTIFHTCKYSSIHPFAIRASVYLRNGIIVEDASISSKQT